MNGNIYAEQENKRKNISEYRAEKAGKVSAPLNIDHRAGQCAESGGRGGHQKDQRAYE